MSANVQISQQRLCAKYQVDYCKSVNSHNCGIAGNYDQEIWPINGLRHPVTEDTTGWYIWRGEFSQNQNFFEPMCTDHLLNYLPKISKYLGLPPGWRFQLAPGHEDVWYDEELLKA